MSDKEKLLFPHEGSAKVVRRHVLGVHCIANSKKKSKKKATFLIFVRLNLKSTSERSERSFSESIW